jgi:hypothetical protein
MWARQTPEAVAWLGSYGDPEWDAYFNKQENIICLYNRLGYWPRPINIEVEEFPQEPNDELPF